MDSTAYGYLIRDLQQEPDPGFSIVPITFVKSPVALTRESLSSLQQFLRAIIRTSERGDDRPLLPLMLTIPGNFFGQLFLEAHRALAEVVAGTEPLAHQFRNNGSQLAKFLCFCAQRRSAAIASQTDFASLAMYCFLLEGAANAGWCSDSCENAKRSAHSYFIALKKGLRGLRRTASATILGYMWGSWLLAQKTEGMNDIASEPNSSFLETFAWHIGNISHSYVGRNFVKPYVFHLLAMSSSRIPHPFARLSLDGCLGLTMHANGEAIRPLSLQEVSDIVRPKMAGNKFVFACHTPSLPGISWTVVFLVLESTTYRIDILKFPLAAQTLEMRGEMRLENEAHLDQQGADCYFGRDVENTVIRFVENPLNFRFDTQQESGISVFTSRIITLLPGSSLTTVTAWARGKGITALNEARLLGMYD